MYTLGIGLDDSKAALAWAPHVEVALERGKVDRRAWASFHDYRALALEDLGRPEEAAAAIALAIDDWRSIESADAAIELAEREARLAVIRGDLRLAISRQREVSRLIEELDGWPHPSAVVATDRLANYLELAGDLDASVAAFERALEGARDALGVDHPLTLSVAANLAGALATDGRLEEALDHYEHAREGFERTTGKEHPRYIGVVANMAATLGRAGRHAESLEWAEETIGPIEAHFGREHRVTGYVYVTIGTSRRRSGDPQGAIPALERALAIYDAQGIAAAEAAEVQFELADALVEAGGDRERALRLVRTAQKAWNDAGRTEDVAIAARWLQEH